MGTCITTSESDFRMTERNAAAAAAVLGQGRFEGTVAEQLQEVFYDQYDMELTWEDGKGVVGVSLDCEKVLSSGDQLMEDLGPYVDAGCYVQVATDDGDTFRYTFDGKRCEIVCADMERAFQPDYKKAYGVVLAEIEREIRTCDECAHDAREKARRPPSADHKYDGATHLTFARMHEGSAQDYRKLLRKVQEVSEIYLSND